MEKLTGKLPPGVTGTCTDFIFTVGKEWLNSPETFCRFTISDWQEVAAGLNITWMPASDAWRTIADICPESCSLHGVVAGGGAPPSLPSPPMFELVRQIADGTDDAEERAGQMYLDSSDLELG